MKRIISVTLFDRLFELTQDMYESLEGVGCEHYEYYNQQIKEIYAEKMKELGQK